MRIITILALTFLLLFSCNEGRASSNQFETANMEIKKESEFFLDYENSMKNLPFPKLDEFPENWKNNSYFQDISYYNWKSYYDNIKQVNFARHFIIVQNSCGTSCISGMMIDARNGNVYDLPHLSFWEGNGNLGIDFSPENNLLIAHQEVFNELTKEISSSTANLKWIESQKSFELILPYYEGPWEHNCN